jgi:hypothetical protein
MNAELVVDYGEWVMSHFAGADRVVARGRGFGHVPQNILARFAPLAGSNFILYEGSEGGGIKYLA